MTKLLHRIQAIVTVSIFMLSVMLAFVPKPVHAKIGKDCSPGREAALRKNNVDVLDACDYGITCPATPTTTTTTTPAGPIPAGGSDTLEGHKLPATHGGTGQESEAFIDSNGVVRLLHIAGQPSLAVGGSMKNILKPIDVKFYSNMRTRPFTWKWDGSSKVNGSEKDTKGWYYSALRKILVINPRTKKAVVTALIETGPAPWTGTKSNSRGSVPSYWSGYVEGTPAEYDGRVAGLAPAAMKAIDAAQWQYGGPSGGRRNSQGDDLQYRWAPDQSVESGTVYEADAIPGGISPAPDGPAAPASEQCTPGTVPQVAVSASGFVFPLQVKKSIIRSQKPDQWCENNNTNCHHHYNAADIFTPPGTPIVASRPGKVVRTGYSDKFGRNVQIKGDDGINYYYTHMPKDGNVVHVGDTITAGQLLGHSGESKNANGTEAHLHFDMTNGASRPSCSANECLKDYPGRFITVQPFLREAYKSVPE